MFKSVKEFDEMVVTILTKLRDGGNMLEIPVGATKTNYNDVMEYIIENRYVNGLKCKWDENSGDLGFVNPARPRISRAGLEFLERIERK